MSEEKPPGGVAMLHIRRRLTADEARALQAKIDAKLEACRQGWEKANGSEERAFYVFSALNFCGGRPLPYWLLTAVTALAFAQLPPTPKEVAFLLNEREMIRSLAAEYKAEAVRNPRTEPSKMSPSAWV